MRVGITLAGYNYQNVPLYVVIGISFLIGLLLSWLFTLMGTLSGALKLRKKDHHIQDAKKTIHELTKKVNELEIKNAELESQLDSHDADPHAL